MDIREKLNFINAEIDYEAMRHYEKYDAAMRVLQGVIAEAMEFERKLRDQFWAIAAENNQAFAAWMKANERILDAETMFVEQIGCTIVDPPKGPEEIVAEAKAHLAGRKREA